MSDHEHLGPPLDPIPLADGDYASAQSLSDLLGAARDGCAPCRAERTQVILDSPTRIVVLSFLACSTLDLAIHLQELGLMKKMSAPAALHLPSQLVLTAQELSARIWVVTEMDEDSRRAVVEDSVDIIIGLIDKANQTLNSNSMQSPPPGI